MAILCQTALRESWVAAVLKKIPAGTYFNEVSGRTQPMIYFSGTRWCPDPGYSMQLHFDSVAVSNYGNSKNDRGVELIKAALLSADNAERFAIMAEVQKFEGEEATWVLVSYPNYIIARPSNVQGFVCCTANNLRFQDLSYA